jgi:TonB-linked SusC/RagA family outer membrane protein
MTKLVFCGIMMQCVLFCFSTAADLKAGSQDQEISEIITSSIYTNGMLGVNVFIKNSSQGKVKGIAIDTQSFSDVAFLSDTAIFGETVEIGYGTKKKSDLIGSVSSLSAEELVDRPVINVGQALQNKVAGVHVMKQGGGYPGSRPMIRIRGINSIHSNSDPLFVVDGIVGVLNAMQNINPQDILTVDILKDASATAIYGSRGANGVIIITTKRGEVGKIKINYSGSMTMGMMTRNNNMVTSDQFMYLYEQAFTNTPKYGDLNLEKDFRATMGTGDSWSEMPHLFEQVSQGEYFMDVFGNDGNYYKPRFYSDWEDIAFNPSFSYDQHIDVSGGSENAKFSLSVGHTDQDGLLIESYYKRTNAKITGDIKINKWLGVSANMMYSRAKSASGLEQLSTVSETWPILPTKYPKEAVYGLYAGKWSTGMDFPVGENWRNIVYTMDQTDGYNLNQQFTGGIILKAQITGDLSFKLNISADNLSEDSKMNNGDYQGTSTSNKMESNQKWFYWQNENYFNYDKTVGAHSFVGMAGLSWSETTYEWGEARDYNFSSDFDQDNNLESGTNTPSIRSSNSRSALNSYFVRANYTFQGKYLITASGRYDGGPNNKGGFFPSIGVGWKISDEAFMSASGIVSNLKLRGSAGQTGNQQTSVMYGGSYPDSSGNPDLKWETTRQFDVGIDLGMFNNRINLVLDVYNKLTDDMLFNLPLPGSTTPGGTFVNFGSVKNTGVEVDLSTVNIEKNDFSWEIHLTVSANKNEIMELGPTDADVYVNTGSGSLITIYRIGEPIGSFLGLRRVGVYSTKEAALAARYGRLPGDLKFEDVNQDGKIELRSDGNIIGQFYPDVCGGLNNTFRYKHFDAAIGIQFVGGLDKAIVHESAEDRQFVSGMANSVLDAWRPDYQELHIMVAQVRAGNAGARYDSFSDTHGIYNGSFIRGSVASLGYTISDKFGMDRLRIYATAENFFLLTAIELEGYNLENGSLDNSNTQNMDKYQYPTPSNFSLGVNVSF